MFKLSTVSFVQALHFTSTCICHVLLVLFGSALLLCKCKNGSKFESGVFFFFFCGEYKGMVLIVASAGLSGQFCASKHEVIAA